MPADRLKPAPPQLAAACCDLVRRGRESRREGAGDVVQDACLRLLQFDVSRNVREPTRYLARIARNLSIDRARRRHREVELFDSSVDAALVPDGGLDPERIISGEQALMRALAAIEALPPRCREAFELHRFEGLSYISIANRMGISISMVEKHLAGAMLQLSRALALTEERPTLRRRRRPTLVARMPLRLAAAREN